MTKCGRLTVTTRQLARKSSLHMPWGRMAYSLAGDGGLALVFLHGTGCDANDWEHVSRRLPSSLQRVSVDFRGHGASDVPAGEFTIDDLAADVVALLDALQLKRAILVGHSLGGMVAIAASRSKRIVGLALFEAWTRLQAARSFALDRHYGTLAPLAIRRIREKSVRTTSAFRAPVWKAFWKSVERFDGRPCLRAAGMPVFEVYGEMGKTASTEASLLIPPNPAIEIFWVPGAGHYLPHEKPVEVAKICKRMIDRCEPAK